LPRREQEICRQSIEGTEDILKARSQSILAVADLYWYFKVTDKSQNETEAEAVTA
jgi:hypothetical protein